MDGNSNAGKMILGIAVLALIVGGIFLFTSSDDSDTADDTSSANETSQAADDAAPEAVEQDNIVELAAGAEDLSTLVAAVQAADLVDTLSSEAAEYTVFAPTNAAFDALPAGTLDDLLLPENKDQLTSILTYHVVANEVFSSDLEDGQVIETINGQSLTVSITDEGVMIGDAMVVTPDVDASNGVVHIIDTVLLPN